MSLAAEDIRVRLGESIVLEGVSVLCRTGQITGLVGPNGAGKSTLLRALAGLLDVEAGRVVREGGSLPAHTSQELGRHIAYLPQIRTVHWPLSVERVVALGRLPHGGAIPGAGRSDTAGARAVDDAMRTMNVSHFADRPVSALSGGELARVLIARALAQEAPIIVADEPTAGLDPAYALGLFEVLSRLATDGRTIVVALHDLSLAARFCHEVVVLASGRVVAKGPSADVLIPPTLEMVFGAKMAVGSVGGVPAIVPVSPLP